MVEEYNDTLWTIVALGDDLFALRADDVHSMVILPPVSGVPNTPPYVRGVFLLRNKPVPVIDLRTRLGMVSLSAETEELLSMLGAREDDHTDWLDELELSVKDRRIFKMTTDPHACAFGKWYDTYKTDSLLLKALLKKFDAPHRRIHGIADEVVALEKSGDLDAAQALIDKTRGGDLAEMVRLFAMLRDQIRDSQREIAVVLSVNDKMFSVAVDAVETVSRLVVEADKDLQDSGIGLTEEGLVTAVGKLDKSGRLVVILDAGRILSA